MAPKNALIKQYEKLFSMEGSNSRSPGALPGDRPKGTQAQDRGRGLRSILESALLDIMYDLPTMDDVTKVVIDEGAINGTSAPILIYADQQKCPVRTEHPAFGAAFDLSRLGPHLGPFFCQENECPPRLNLISSSLSCRFAAA